MSSKEMAEEFAREVAKIDKQLLSSAAINGVIGILNLAREWEREACAKIAEEQRLRSGIVPAEEAYKRACEHIAAAIRARKEGE